MAFTARSGGWCNLCGREVYPGDVAGYWGRKVVHDDCRHTAQVRLRPGRVMRAQKPSTYRRGKSPGSYG